MTALGHEATFGMPLNRVRYAAVNRHSAPNVGNAPVSGPEALGQRRSELCQEATFDGFAPRVDFSPSIR